MIFCSKIHAQITRNRLIALCWCCEIKKMILIWLNSQLPSGFSVWFSQILNACCVDNWCTLIIIKGATIVAKWEGTCKACRTAARSLKGQQRWWGSCGGVASPFHTSWGLEERCKIALLKVKSGGGMICHQRHTQCCAYDYHHQSELNCQ